MIEVDGIILIVEQIFFGFEENLNFYKFMLVDIVCVFCGGSYVIEFDKCVQFVMGNKDGSIVGYKYFDFGQFFFGQKMIVIIWFCDGVVVGNIEIWFGDFENKGECIGVVLVEKNFVVEGWWCEIMIFVLNISGCYVVYLWFMLEFLDIIVVDLWLFVFICDMD